MHSPTFLLPLSLYLFLTISVSPSTSLAIASAASPIAAHAKHHINARRPDIPPEQHQEAPPVGIPEPQPTGNENEFDPERKGDEPAHEFDTGVPATPEELERHGEIDQPPAEPEPERHQPEQQQEEPHPQPQEDPKPETPEAKPQEAQKPIAEKKKKPKKSLYTWPLLKTDILDCCPKYAYNCADRKAICHDGQRAEV